MPKPWATTRQPISLTQLQDEGLRFHSVIYEPQFEKSPQEIAATVSNTLSQAEHQIELIGHRARSEVNFSNTFAEFDQLTWNLSSVARRLRLLSEESTNTVLRAAAREWLKTLTRGWHDAAYQPEIYQAMRMVAESHPQLQGEDVRLLKANLQWTEEMGLGLPEQQCNKVKELWGKLTAMEMDFSWNLGAPPPVVRLSQAEVQGIPRALLRQYRVKKIDGLYEVPSLYSFMATARQEETRKKLWIANANRVANTNTALLQGMIECRYRLAKEFGFKSWAEFQARHSMVGSPSAAREFCEEVRTRLRPKFEAELKELTQLKIKETGDPNSQVQVWDLAYFDQRRQRQRHAVNQRKFLSYFASGQVMDGMFSVFERIFAIKIQPVENHYQWKQGIQLFAVSDSKTDEPLGLIYFSPYTRAEQTKEDHEVTLIPGKQLPDGGRQCPVAVVSLRGSAPLRNRGIFLYPNGVRTLFHEFGHALHEVLSRSKYEAFAGNNVPRDYIEVPSELFELWPNDRQVLDTFAHDFMFTSMTLPPALLNELRASRNEQLESLLYSSAIALSDLALHGQSSPADCVKLSNQILSEAFLPIPSNAAPITSSSTIVGYPATAYSYLWGKAVAADIASEFENAPERFLDRDTGMRLRHEIFETGSIRSAKQSVAAFLGRPFSTEAFLKELEQQKP